MRGPVVSMRYSLRNLGLGLLEPPTNVLLVVEIVVEEYEYIFGTLPFS
jgi:hypothetical protein